MFWKVSLGVILFTLVSGLFAVWAEARAKKQRAMKIAALPDLDIADQATLIRAAEELWMEDGLMEKVVPRLENQEALAKLAKRVDRPKIAKAAIQRMTDQRKLLEIVRFYTRSSATLNDSPAMGMLRSEAVSQVTDETLLAEIAIMAESDYSSLANSVDRITDETLLKRVALEAPSKQSRWKAITRINDVSALDQIASREPNDDNRRSARNRIEFATRDSVTNSNCSICSATFNLSRTIAAGVYLGEQLMDEVTRTPYRCRRCGALVCMSCVQANLCKCGHNTFDAATDLLS